MLFMMSESPMSEQAAVVDELETPLGLLPDVDGVLLLSARARDLGVSASSACVRGANASE